MRRLRHHPASSSSAPEAHTKNLAKSGGAKAAQKLVPGRRLGQPQETARFLYGSMTMRVAIYARVSTDEQELREPIAGSCGRGARRPVTRSLQEYIDHGVSGKQPAARRNRFACAARGCAQAAGLTSCCAGRSTGSAARGWPRRVGTSATSGGGRRGVRHSYTEPMLSTDNEMVRDILLAVMASLAKQERVRHVERVKAGIARAREARHEEWQADRPSLASPPLRRRRSARHWRPATRASSRSRARSESGSARCTASRARGRRACATGFLRGRRRCDGVPRTVWREGYFSLGGPSHIG